MMRGFGGFGGFGGHMGGFGGFGSGAFGSNGFWIPMLIGGLFKVILLAAVIYIVYRLLKNKGNYVHANHDSAMAILKERYAKGEITEEEFTQRKELLIK